MNKALINRKMLNILKEIFLKNLQYLQKKSSIKNCKL